jgi:hypothetical protein
MAPHFNKNKSIESTITLEEKNNNYQPMVSAQITLDNQNFLK